MKCEKCGNEYPSNYYFAAPNICNECFNKMLPEEKQAIQQQFTMANQLNMFDKRVGFGKRLAAILIDYVILSIIIIVVYQFTGFFESSRILGETIEAIGPTNPEALTQVTQEFFQNNILYFYFAILITLIYFLSEVIIGASLGKIILGIQIGDLEMKKASVSQLTTRFIIKNMNTIISLIWVITLIDIFNTIGFLIFIALFIGFFFVLSNKKQDFQDMIAKTAVYSRKDIIEVN